MGGTRYAEPSAPEDSDDEMNESPVIVDRHEGDNIASLRRTQELYEELERLGRHFSDATVAVIGPSASGKSALINTINHVLKENTVYDPISCLRPAWIPGQGTVVVQSVKAHEGLTLLDTPSLSSINDPVHELIREWSTVGLVVGAQPEVPSTRSLPNRTLEAAGFGAPRTGAHAFLFVFSISSIIVAEQDRIGWRHLYAMCSRGNERPLLTITLHEHEDRESDATNEARMILSRIFTVDPDSIPVVSVATGPFERTVEFDLKILELVSTSMKKAERGRGQWKMPKPVIGQIWQGLGGGRKIAKQAIRMFLLYAIVSRFLGSTCAVLATGAATTRWLYPKGFRQGMRGSQTSFPSVPQRVSDTRTSSSFRPS